MDLKRLSRKATPNTKSHEPRQKGEMRRLKPGQLAAKADYVVSKMTGNPNFATPNPDLASITDASTAHRRR